MADDKKNESDTDTDKDRDENTKTKVHTNKNRNTSPSPKRIESKAKKEKWQDSRKSKKSPERSNNEPQRPSTRDADRVNNNETGSKFSESENEERNSTKKSDNAGKNSKEKRNKGERVKKNKKQKKERKNPNKIYRAPPTPPPEWFSDRERKFILDCVAVDSMSREYGRVRPKMGQVVPPYNSVDDPLTSSYFESKNVQKVLKQNDQIPGEPIEGQAVERFFTYGSGFKYLSNRNRNGAGHSTDVVSGHSQFMADVTPISGYNGQFGYRRTTPSLRQCPSTFGVLTSDPIY